MGGELKPVAWMWSQLMHDSMGGWEQKCERRLTPPRVKPDDIRDLTPLYASPPPPSGSAWGVKVKRLAAARDQWNADQDQAAFDELGAAIDDIADEPMTGGGT